MRQSFLIFQVCINSFPSMQIVESLVREESVFPLPGKCFNIPDYFRIVLTVPGDLMAEVKYY